MTVNEPISKVNLERITNAIYAFTLTLMIRNLQTPGPGAIDTAVSLTHYLTLAVYAVIDFIGAFLILGMFWLFYFQVFHRMKTFDFKFLYIHLVSLMVVVFVPFTSIFSTGGEMAAVGDVLFQLNYFILAMVLVCGWHYARSHPELLVPELTGEGSAFLAKKFLVPLGVACIGLGFIVSGIGYVDLLYIAPFIILGLFFRSPPVGNAAPEKT